MNQPPNHPSDRNKTKQQLFSLIEILPTQLARERQYFWQKKVDKKLIAGGFGLAMSILGGVGVATYFSIQQSSTNQHWVEHTYEVLATIDDVSGGVKDVERGRRGYIITNDKYYLKTYNSGIRQTQASVKLLQQLTRDNLEQQQRIEQLNLLIDRRFANTQKSLDLFEGNSLDRETQIKFTNQNRQVQSAIEAKLVEIKDVEKQLQAARSQATANSTRLILLLEIVGYLLSFSLLLTIYYLLRRENDRREQAEKALRESERRYQAIFNQTYQFTGLLSPDGILLEANQSALDFGGLTHADVIGRPVWESPWWQPDAEAQHRLQEAVKAAAAGEFVRYEVEIVGAGGAIATIDFSLKPVWDDNSKVVLLIPEGRDISDRKLAEAILYQRQQEFVALVENSPDVIARFDLQLRHSYINSAIEKELGIPPQAFIGKTVREMDFPTEFADTFEPALQRVLATGQEQIIELSAQTPKGLSFSQTRLMPETAPDGTINSILALSRDITAIRAAEIAQRQQMEREQLVGAIAQHMRESLNLEDILNTTVTELQAFFQADRVLIYQIESNGSGKVVAEALAPGWKSLLDLVLSVEAFPLQAQQQYLRGKVGIICDRDTGTIPPCLVEFMHQTQVRAKLTIPIIQQQKLWGLLIVQQCSQPREWQTWESNLLQQLTHQMAIAIQQSELHQQLQTELHERRQIEQALRQSETKFRLLSENSPLGIFRTNDRGEYTYINPRYQQICDCTFAEAMGRGWLQLIHPENRDFVISQNSKAVCERKSCLSEFHFVRKDGSSRYCRVQAAPLFNDETYIGHVGTIEDITESRAIAQMKNEFIGIVSHELRTPLTSLRGSLGLLATGVYDNKPEKSKRMLQVAAESAARLVRLVSDILDLERLESGKVTLEFQSCNAADLMLQSVEAMRASAEQNQVTLSVTPLQAQIWAAPDAIVQTLTNLLSNAVKFSPPGSTVWLSAEICKTVGAHSHAPLPQPTPYILFQVKDRGRGIPSDKLETIFGQFQQVDVSDSRQKGGTGLGLAICRSIIRQHGGQIWAESTFGKGSSFYFTLPLNTVISYQLSMLEQKSV